MAEQLGRTPRGAWRVTSRCEHGFPNVIVTAPVLETDAPFPTLYWLTCPWLVAATNDLESAGGCDAWALALAGDPILADRMRLADAEYRRLRSAEALRADPLPGRGIAGQRDPLATKCLHAHVAAYLAGIDDPVGEGVASSIGHACTDRACERLGSSV